MNTNRKGWTVYVCDYIDVLFLVYPDEKGYSELVIMWGKVDVIILSQKQNIVTKDLAKSELVVISNMFESV